MPKKFKRKKFKEPEWLQKIHTPTWLVLIISLIFLFRVPTFFEPFHYGDELIYITIGQGIKRGMVLFKDINDNKPPLIYAVAAIAGNLFWLRAILAGWMMATTIIFWKLTNSLYPKNETLQKVSVSVFAILTTIPLLEGQIANAELFMIGPVIWAFYLLWNKKLTTKTLAFSGILFSIASLFKLPSTVDIVAIIFVWFTFSSLKGKQLKSILNNSIILFVSWSIPIIFTFLFFASQGALNDYISSAFTQNIGYISAFRPQDAQDTFLVRNTPIILRALLAGVGLTILFLSRKKLSKEFVFVSAWLTLSLFAITISERPYPHYLIQFVPSVSILAGILVAKKSLEQSLATIPLLIAFMVPVTFNFWYYPSLSYYKNFVNFTTQKISREEYFSNFNPATNRNYKIAKLIRTSTAKDNKIFVWGDSPPIYALANRSPAIKYVATFHLEDFNSHEQTIGLLKNSPPSLVVILPNSPAFPELEDFVSTNYLLLQTVDGAEVWRKLSQEVLNSL